MSQTSERVLNFLHTMEQLKHECRHSWTSLGRQESVAEHSWRLAVMLIICAPYFDKNFDLLKALKLAILHDIGEARIGDQHYLDVSSKKDAGEERSRLEMQAVEELALLLGADGNPISTLWKEFEYQSSEEAKIVYFLDKLEACIQHNEAHISTWTKRELDSMEEYFNHLKTENVLLLALKRAVKDEFIQKIKMLN